jgi:Spy/CpxP family protein refolding chaperone
VNFWKIILATVVIFGAGVTTGGLLVTYVDHAHPGNVRRPTESDPHPPAGISVPMPHAVEKLGKQFVQQLDDTLRLTPEQRGKIAKIIADGQKRNQEIWRTNAAPLVRQVMQEVNRQIRVELTPEQQKQFEELMKQHPPRHPSSTNAPAVLPLSAPVPQDGAPDK